MESAVAVLGDSTISTTLTQPQLSIEAKEIYIPSKSIASQSLRMEVEPEATIGTE